MRYWQIKILLFIVILGAVLGGRQLYLARAMSADDRKSIVAGKDAAIITRLDVKVCRACQAGQDETFTQAELEGAAQAFLAEPFVKRSGGSLGGYLADGFSIKGSLTDFGAKQLAKSPPSLPGFRVAEIAGEPAVDAPENEDEMKSCAADADCLTVSQEACSCDPVAVNRKFLGAWYRAHPDSNASCAVAKSDARIAACMVKAKCVSGECVPRAGWFSS